MVGGQRMPANTGAVCEAKLREVKNDIWGKAVESYLWSEDVFFDNARDNIKACCNFCPEAPYNLPFVWPIDGRCNCSQGLQPFWDFFETDLKNCEQELSGSWWEAAHFPVCVYNVKKKADQFIDGGIHNCQKDRDQAQKVLDAQQAAAQAELDENTN